MLINFLLIHRNKSKVFRILQTIFKANKKHITSKKKLS